MFRTIFTKTLFDKRWFIFGWLLGLMFMALTVMLVYPSFSQGPSVDELFKNLPPQLQPFVGDITTFKTISGYVGTQLFEIRVPMLMLIMVIILAISISAIEEESGRLQQLVVQPIARGRIFLEKWLALVGIVTLLHAGVMVSIYGTLFAINESMEFSTVFAVTAICWLLTLAIGTLTFSTGYAFGKRGVAVAVGSVVAFGSFFLTSFAKSVDWLEPFGPISLFHYYGTGEVIKSGVDWFNVSVLAGITLVSFLLGWLMFRKRDIVN